MASMEDSHWKFSQCFGEKEEVEHVAEADIITTLEFDETGNYLATGDKGGRAVLFQRDQAKRNCEYHFFAEFQSHEPEFDYLKSLEIEEKVNKIKWCKRQTQAHFLLTTNDKTIKLWKVNEKSIYNVVDNNSIHFKTRFCDAHSLASFTPSPQMLDTDYFAHMPQAHSVSSPVLKLPKVVVQEEIMFAIPKKIYASAHAYHINSISINSDGETFLSSDDLRIHLWSLSNEQQSFNAVDLKPANMEDLNEVITTSEFHPTNCYQFIYGTSKGMVKICDLRRSAICDQCDKVLEDKSGAPKSFFSEIISSISDAKYSRDGRYILVRDYMNLKLWDLHMESKPVLSIPVHEHLRPRLCDLYENDCIFDRFECGFNGSSTQLATGSYNNMLQIYDLAGNKLHAIHSDKSIFLSKKSVTGAGKSKGTSISKKKKDGSMATNVNLNMNMNMNMNGDSSSDGLSNLSPNSSSSTSLCSSTSHLTPSALLNEPLEPNKKILHAVWHPNEDTMAIAATNNLFIFSGAF